MAQVAIVANRAPFSFILDRTSSPSRRAASGLVNAFDSLRMRDDVVWFAVPMSDTEREIAQRGVVREHGFDIRFIPVDTETYDHAYHEVYNGTLWPIFHGLTGWASARLTGATWKQHWQSYRRYNRQVAEAVAAQLPDHALVLAQDLYFVFLASELDRLDARTLKSILFLHLPFATPAELDHLPAPIATEFLQATTRFRAVGFLTGRWEAAFIQCCRDFGVDVPRTFVAPVAPPMKRLCRESSSPECDEQLAHLERLLKGRQMLTQLDRMDPAKNIHRSLQAYDALLETRSELRDKVVFVVLAQLSRQGLADYRDYANHVRQLSRDINDRHGSPTWQPVALQEDFSHFLHLAALRRYDVLLVNSVRDGMNLIALEGPQLNERAGMSVVSPDAGAFDHQRDWVFRANPRDFHETARTLFESLTLDAERRAFLFNGLRTASAAAGNEEEFVNRQIEAASRH